MNLLRRVGLWIARWFACLVTLGYSEHLRRRVWTLEQTGVAIEGRDPEGERFRVEIETMEGPKVAYAGPHGAKARQAFEAAQVADGVYGCELWDGEDCRGRWER